MSHACTLHPALASVVSPNPIYRITLVYSLEGTMQIVHRNLLVLNGDLSYFRWRIDEYIRCLVLSIYHTLYDVRTIVYLLEDVNYNYNHPSYKRPGRALYCRFIEHTSKLDQSVASSYWSNLLQNVPISQYPPLKLYYQARVTYSVEHQIHLDTASMRDSRVTVATVMAAALALIISAYCYTDEVCFGLTPPGRDDLESEDIAGPNLSTVPVRIGIPQDYRMADFLETI